MNPYAPPMAFTTLVRLTLQLTAMGALIAALALATGLGQA